MRRAGINARLGWAIAALSVFAFATTGSSFVLLGSAWPDGNVAFELRLQSDAPVRSRLSDGSASWSDVAEAAIATLNASLHGTRLTSMRTTGGAPVAQNSRNEVVWASSIYGETLDPYVLGVTLIETEDDETVTKETDIVFNSKGQGGWDSYRGPMLNVTDFRRIVLHEFGHALGLGHPDEESQTVSALMNSIAGNIDELRPDDLDGLQYLYGPKVAPSIVMSPQNQTVAPSGSVTFMASVTGRGPMTYQWQKDGVNVSYDGGGAVEVPPRWLDYTVPYLGGHAVGEYRLVVRNAYGVAYSSPARLSFTSGVTQNPADQAVIEGGTAVFSVAVTGTGPISYQWRFQNSNYYSTDIPGATGPTLTLNAVTAANAGEYQARVMIGDVEHFSRAATLAVKLAFTEQPVSQAADVGGAVTLSAAVAERPRLTRPIGLMIDASGQLYVADEQSIRTVSRTGELATIGFYTGGGVAARSPNGTFYFSGLGGSMLRTMPAGGPVMPFGGRPHLVGGGEPGWINQVALGGITGLAADGDETLYIVNRNASTIQRVTRAGGVSTFVGETNPRSWGSPARTPLDGNGKTARFADLHGIARDGAGNLYVADEYEGFGLVRKITPAGAVTTLAGSAATREQVRDGAGGAAAFWRPTAITIDAVGSLYVVDHGTIRKVTAAGVVTTIAGTANSFGYVDARGADARFEREIYGIAAANDGTVFVADANHTIRQIAPDGTVSTLVGEPNKTGYTDGAAPSYQWLKDGVPVSGATAATLTLENLQLAQAGNYQLRATNSYGTITSSMARVDFRPAIARQPGAALAMPGERVTLTVDATSPTNRPLTYQWSRYGVDIPGATQRTYTIPALGATDVAAYRVTVSDGIHTVPSDTVSVAFALSLPETLPQSMTHSAGAEVHLSVTTDGGLEPRFRSPAGLAFDAQGNLFVADRENHCIRKITPAGVVTTLAGSGAYGAADGAGTQASFQYPVALVSGAGGEIYVADTGASTIRKISADGKVTTFAGLANAPGAADGPGQAARFAWPNGIGRDGAGNLYVSDASNHTIRKITPTGVVSTIAGLAGVPGTEDGTAALARFSWPQNIAVSPTGTIYVADGTRSIRKIVDGVVSTLVPAGSGITNPVALAVRQDGYLVVADANEAVRLVAPSGAVTWIAGYSNYTGERLYTPNGVAVDAGGRAVVSDGHALWLVLPDGATSRLAGHRSEMGSRDGMLTQYQWRHNGAAIPGATGSLLVLHDVQAAAAGSYSVTASNPYGQLTSQTVVSVAPSAPWDIRFERATRWLSPGGSVGFSVSATGSAPLVYQWLKNGVPISGAQSASYVIENATPSDDGLYAVTVSNAVGSSTTVPAAVNVRVAGAPEIVGHPQANQYPESGYPVVLTVTASGNGPLQYQWSRDGVEIAGATTSELTFGRVTTADTASYTVTVTNAAGRAVSAVAFIYVRAAEVPRFNYPLQSATAYNGVDFSFYAGAYTVGLASYQWMKDGSPIAGATGDHLRLQPALPTDAGSYSVTVTNDAGTVTSSSAQLTVLNPTLPSNGGGLTVWAGQTTWLSVYVPTEIAGAMEWQRNGTPMVWTNGQIGRIDSVSSEDAGLYSVVLPKSVPEFASAPVILGLWSAEKVIGAGTVVGERILHPNGNVFDQILVTGAAETIRAEPGRVTRTSFIDLNHDIVQVEFSGSGTLSLVLESAGSPAPASRYKQSIEYVQGHAGIVVSGADETTNVSVFSVGRATAVDPSGRYNLLLPPSPTNDPALNASSLFEGHAETSYDGVADIAFIAISSSNGKFGGVRAANTSFFATKGYTGLYAPDVSFQGPVNLGNIDAFDAARPVLVVGSSGEIKITGGDLAQTNDRPIAIGGPMALRFTDGSDSHGRLQRKQSNHGSFEKDGVDAVSDVTVLP